MEWTTSIQEITEDRNRQTDNLLNSGTIEEGAIDGRFSSESEEKVLMVKTSKGYSW